MGGKRLFKKKDNFNELIKDGWLKMYEKISGSDLNGNIANKNVIKMLYAMMCIDEKTYKCKVKVPDIAIPVLSKELLDLYDTYGSSYVDGEDYSYIDMSVLAEAFVIYLRETQKDIKEIHTMSRYDLASEIIRLFEEKE